MNTDHTPGPWIVEADLPSVDPDWYTVTTANRLRVIANIHIEPGDPVDMDNAKLIAAAPDMFAALKGIVEYYGGAALDFPVIRSAAEAVAKAERGA